MVLSFLGDCSSPFCRHRCRSPALAVKVLATLSKPLAASRVYMRALGVFVCLFVLVPISWSMTTFEGFDKNILLALWTLPVLMPIFLWILWRYSPLKQANRRYLAGGGEEPQWELRMSVAFCSLLSVIVVVAMLLAMSGIYPK
jgi:hypothetical protein